ncbi:hypothetical protein P4607_30350 [Priestia megaterium]|uniref:hypothetical protein n=1 Tax=Priestia megaterium TaxID=1404 RepID=UPI002E1ACDB6|nr:hypothetical protein [Priestia megaterium]
MATTKTKKNVTTKDPETDTTIIEQLTYYRMLAPLEVRSLLSHLNSSGKKSISPDIKKFKNGDLDPLGKTFIEGVDKQQERFTKASEKKILRLTK